ncbi:hypothetical protein EVAR_37631_1 [Eumeta japonica]|uniref:Uncharacterized protein n=1 Tax=Eumeta variegata TaxID=151549 RepID=A0A4C1VNW7_EUMVA|nr:hypothetical protein EVAR_37631_1 [Eumeta japonica]
MDTRNTKELTRAYRFMCLILLSLPFWGDGSVVKSVVFKSKVSESNHDYFNHSLYVEEYVKLSARDVITALVTTMLSIFRPAKSAKNSTSHNFGRPTQRSDVTSRFKLIVITEIAVSPVGIRSATRTRRFWVGGVPKGLRAAKLAVVTCAVNFDRDQYLFLD